MTCDLTINGKIWAVVHAFWRLKELWILDNITKWTAVTENMMVSFDTWKNKSTVYSEMYNFGVLYLTCIITHVSSVLPLYSKTSSSTQWKTKYDIGLLIWMLFKNTASKYVCMSLSKLSVWQTIKVGLRDLWRNTSWKDASTALRYFL